jgi:3-oxoacyl-[acyl-carrier-protein] synthase-1
MTPLPITDFTLVTALGAGREATLAALEAQRSGLAPARFLDVELPTWVGRGRGPGRSSSARAHAEFDCRNNRLAWMGPAAGRFRRRRRQGAAALGRAADRRSSSARAPAGLLETELGYRRRGADGRAAADVRYDTQQNTYSVGAFVKRALELQGPELGRCRRVLVERQGVRDRRRA